MSQVDGGNEVIVIDDRSNDETGQILEKLATESDRLTTIRVETVPDGWLGKCHACHLGSERARGDWLLFMDADGTVDDANGFQKISDTDGGFEATFVDGDNFGASVS